MIISNVEQCFSNCLFPDTEFGVDNNSDSDRFDVHVGKTHVFVIMTMNNGKRRGQLIVTPLCKNPSLVVSS